MAVKNNNDHLKKIEETKLETFVDNYIKNNLDHVDAYKKTFDKQLWLSEVNAKKRADELISSIRFIEYRNQKIDNLREVYKEEISNSFNFLNQIVKDETYTSYEHFFDIKKNKAIEYKVKKNIKHSDKIKAAELMLKVFSYLDKNTNIIVDTKEKNEFEVQDEQIDNVINSYIVEEDN